MVARSGYSLGNQTLLLWRELHHTHDPAYNNPELSSSKVSWRRHFPCSRQEEVFDFAARIARLGEDISHATL